jgi:hypothetical protein
VRGATLPALTPSMLSRWAEEELRKLRTEKRPLLAHMLGEHRPPAQIPAAPLTPNVRSSSVAYAQPADGYTGQQRLPHW